MKNKIIGWMLIGVVVTAGVIAAFNKGSNLSAEGIEDAPRFFLVPGTTDTLIEGLNKKGGFMHAVAVCDGEWGDEYLLITTPNGLSLAKTGHRCNETD